MHIEIYLGVAGLLLLLCVFANKISDRYGIPSLLLFLAMGMLAGSDGLGRIYFHDAKLANTFGTIALIFILFTGGLETSWSGVKTIWFRGGLLSTLGVFLTAAFLFGFTYYILRLPRDMSLLLSVIVSSTDAPAMFAIMRNSNLKLKSRLRSLLEFESGSNDPMAVFLSFAVLNLISSQQIGAADIALVFFQQMVFGVILGTGIGWVAAFFLRKWCLCYQGLYPVYGVAIVFLTFAITQLLKGNGYLAVYLAGIVMGNTPFLYRRHFIKFNDSLSWIMQISMFLILGLLVNPHELFVVMPISLACTLFLIFLARPLAVFLCLFKSNYTYKEQIFIGWAGLKGAVPIILATYPLMEKIPHAQTLFNLIFFLVIISVLLQGKTMPFLARHLNLNEDDK